MDVVAVRVAALAKGRQEVVKEGSMAVAARAVASVAGAARREAVLQ